MGFKLDQTLKPSHDEYPLEQIHVTGNGIADKISLQQGDQHVTFDLHMLWQFTQMLRHQVDLKYLVEPPADLDRCEE